MTMLPNMHAKMPWDILKDFEPVSLVATVEWGLVATQRRAVRKTRRDLIAAAKAEPGQDQLRLGRQRQPAAHRDGAVRLAAPGISLTHVPYKGATQAALDVAAGQVPVAFQGLATVASLARGGKLRLIGVTTPARHAAVPDVPTVSESGLPGFEFNSWFADHGAGRHAEGHRRAPARRSGEGAGGRGRAREAAVPRACTLRGSSPEELRKATAEQLAKYARADEAGRAYKRLNRPRMR